WQNATANAAGQAILNQLQHNGSNGTVFPTDPIPDGADSFDAIREQFAYQTRFNDGYSLFVHNQGTLTVTESAFARALAVTGNRPNVYLETTGGDLVVANGAAADDVLLRGLTEPGQTDNSPGLVLIAGNQLHIVGSMTTVVNAADLRQTVNNTALNANAF